MIDYELLEENMFPIFFFVLIFVTDNTFHELHVCTHQITIWRRLVTSSRNLQSRNLCEKLFDKQVP